MLLLRTNFIGRLPCRRTMSTGKLLDQFNVFQSIESPRSPAIQKCKRDGFVVGNINLRGGLAILNGGVFLWDVQRPEELRREHFSLLELTRPYPEILLVGTGEQMAKLPADVADMLRQRGIQYETMNSRNACSTYNVLSEEDRNVSVLLLPGTPVSAREPNHPPAPEEN